MKNAPVFRVIVAAAPLLAFCACGGGEAPFLASGVFEATEVIVSAEATGRLLELTAEEGTTVTADDVVGKVDCRQLELQREQLTTRIAGMHTRVTDVGTQTAALNQQIAAAVREKDRILELVRGGSATGKNLDDINAQIAVLRRQKAAATQSLTTGNQVIDDETAAMNIQAAQLDDQIARCTIKSPVGGTILVMYAERGEVTTMGKALFKVGDMENMFLRAYVTADQLTTLRLGQTVRLQADFGATESRMYDGRIAWISDKAEFTPRTIQTRDERANQVYAVKIAVKNDGFLKLGMYGVVLAENQNAGASGSQHQ